MDGRPNRFLIVCKRMCFLSASFWWFYWFSCVSMSSVVLLKIIIDQFLWIHCQTSSWTYGGSGASILQIQGLMIGTLGRHPNLSGEWTWKWSSPFPAKKKAHLEWPHEKIFSQKFNKNQAGTVMYTEYVHDICSYLMIRGWADVLKLFRFMWSSPAWIDAFREFRFWLSPSTNQCPWGGILLVIWVTFLCGCCCGTCIGAFAFSRACRHLVLQLAGVLIDFCGARGAAQEASLALRQRFAQYRAWAISPCWIPWTPWFHNWRIFDWLWHPLELKSQRNKRLLPIALNWLIHRVFLLNYLYLLLEALCLRRPPPHWLCGLLPGIRLSWLQIPESLLALDLTPLRSLEEGCRLRTVGVWTSFGRLARAFQCGRAAHEAIHQGHLRVPAVQTPPVLLRDTVFVCLCCPRKPAGFWTTTKRSYTSLTGDYSGRGLRRELPGLVGFSFPSQSEAAAFLLGAEAAWPPRVQWAIMWLRTSSVRRSLRIQKSGFLQCFWWILLLTLISGDVKFFCYGCGPLGSCACFHRSFQCSTLCLKSSKAQGSRRSVSSQRSRWTSSLQRARLLEPSACSLRTSHGPI